ncbi:MAG: hypothetical protein FJZ16_08740 [Candidatus Omnitrophica bacterium]|nr:hypothetical protein [Candidatus Omnitrophota bacterium]
MNYNKDLLKSWIDEGIDYEENDDLTSEEFKILHLKHCIKINKRIKYCKELLVHYKDPFIYYTLADLYNRYDFDEAGRILYKQDVRFYCIMAIRQDRNYAPAWVLLAETYWWLAIVVGAEAISDSPELKDQDPIFQEGKKRQIGYIEKAISYIKKALKIEPVNEEYKDLLEFYYQERNDMYCS